MITIQQKIRQKKFKRSVWCQKNGAKGIFLFLVLSDSAPPSYALYFEIIKTKYKSTYWWKQRLKLNLGGDGVSSWYSILRFKRDCAFLSYSIFLLGEEIIRLVVMKVHHHHQQQLRPLNWQVNCPSLMATETIYDTFRLLKHHTSFQPFLTTSWVPSSVYHYHNFIYSAIEIQCQCVHLGDFDI